MKKIEFTSIDIDDRTYPLYCDMRVLEQIQESGMSINQFERDLLGTEVLHDEDGDPIHNEDGTLKVVRKPDPNIKTIMMGLTLMINEAFRIEAMQNGTDPEEVSQDELEIINDKPYALVATIVHSAFSRCFTIKKKLTEKKARTSKRMTR